MKMKEKLKFIHIDTSDDGLTTVLLFNLGHVSTYEISQPKSHLKFLVPLIKQALNEHRILFADLDFISVNEGPGSWTGLRIGITTVKVLCLINNLRLITLNNFEYIRSSTQNSPGLYLIKCSQLNYYFRFYSEVSSEKFEEGIASEEKILTKWEGADKFYLSAPSHSFVLDLVWEKFSKENFSHPDSLEPYYVSDGNLISNFKVASK